MERNEAIIWEDFLEQRPHRTVYLIYFLELIIIRIWGQNAVEW